MQRSYEGGVAVPQTGFERMPPSPQERRKAALAAAKKAAVAVT